MFSCKNCKKEFSSEKKYINHTETCNVSKNMDEYRNFQNAEDLDNLSPQSNVSAISRVSRMSRVSRASTMSHANLDNSNTQLKLEILLQDKSRLKSDNRKYKDMLRSIESTKNTEIQNISDSYDSEIYSLKLKNGDLVSKVNELEEEMFIKTETVRKEYTRKLQAEKQKMNDKFSDKNFEKISLLTQSISTLQNKLSYQMEENSKMVEHHQNQISILNDKHFEKITAMKEEMSLFKSSVESEREEIRKLTTSLSNEKQNYKYNFNKNKESEINIVEVNNRMILEDMQRQLQTANCKLEETVRDNTIKTEHIQSNNTKNINELQNELDRIREHHKTNEVYITQQHKGLIENITNKHSMDIELLNDKFKYELENTILTSSQTIDNTNKSHLLDIEKLNETIKRKECELDTMSKTLEEDKTKMHKDNIIYLKEKETNMTNEITSREIIIKAEYDNLLQEKDVIITTIENTNAALGKTLNHYKDAMEQMELDTTSIKKTFLVNLNKERTNSTDVIKEREDHILMLKKNLETIHVTCTEKMNKAKTDLNNKQSSIDRHVNDSKIQFAKISEYEETIKRMTNESLYMVEKYDKLVNSIKSQVENELTNKHEEELNLLTINNNTILSEYENNIKTLNEKIGVVENKLFETISMYENRVLELTTKNGELQETIDELKVFKDKCLLIDNTYNEHKIHLNNKILEMQLTNQKIQIKLDEKIITIDDYKQILTDNKKLYEDQLNQLKVDKTKIFQLDTENKELKQMNNKLSVELANPSKNMLSESRLKKMRDDCMISLREYRNKNIKLNEEIEHLNKNIQVLEALGEQKEKEVIRILKLYESDSSKNSDNISRIEKEFTDKIKSMDVDIGLKKREIDVLNQSNSNINLLEMKYTNSMKKVSEQVDEINNHKQMIQSLQSKLNEVLN
jgi:hypothetical protein